MADIQFQARVERRDRLVREVDSLQKMFRTGTAPHGSEQRMVEMKTAVERANAEIAEMEQIEVRRAEIDELATKPEHCEDGMDTAPRRRSRPPMGQDERHTAALRLVEERSNADEIPDEAAAKLERHIAHDRTAFDVEYIRAVGNPAYERAFARRLLSPTGPVSELEPDETEALREVGRVMQVRAALGISAGPTGGFALPLTLDPTIMLVTDGSINPWRQLATVRSISTPIWKGVTSEGVTASFVNEGTEATNNAPTLAELEIEPQKAHSFVPFSIEIGHDWPQIQSEMLRLFADAKDVLEAEKFTKGAGGVNPEGFFAGIANGSVIDTAVASTFGIADVYELQEAIPPRFSQGASWVSTNAVMNAMYRFVGTDSDEPPIVNSDRTRILGRGWTEVPDMDEGVTTAGQKILAYAKWKDAFHIVDRIGGTVELVPHLFGENNLPTGQRGLYYYWRTTSKVVIDNAARVLKVKAP